MIISKTNLASIMRRLSGVINNKALPALQNILCRQDAEGLHFIATDLQTQYKATLPSPPAKSDLARRLAALRGTEEFLLPAITLRECAAQADKGSDLALEAEGVYFHLSGQESFVPCVADAVDMFPVAPALEDPTGFASVATDALARCLRCASRDEARYVLNGVHWDSEKGFIATDGRRLHAEECLPCPHPAGAIIPTAVVKMLCAMASPMARLNECEMADEPPTFIEIRSCEDGIEFQIIAKLVAGRFPNWRQVVPESCENRLRFNNTEAAAALRKLLALQKTGKPDTNSTRIEAIPHGIRFTARRDGIAVGQITLPAIHSGNPTYITMNSAWIIDALENGCDTIEFECPITPAKFTGIKKNLHILMPMRSEESTPQAAPEETTEDIPEEVEA
jgi:DNA polymerase-3 subunit beta